MKGADYYLLCLYVGRKPYRMATGHELSTDCGLEAYGDSGSCVIVKDAKADLSNILSVQSEVYFEVGGYSSNIQEYYTPLYKPTKSDLIF